MSLSPNYRHPVWMWLPEDLPHPAPPDTDPRLPLGVPFSLAEARRFGITERVLHRMVRDGLVRRLFPGVYVESAAEDDVHMRAKALSLVVPQSAVVTDRSAAWLHGVDVLAAGDHVVPPPISIFQPPARTRVRKTGCAGGERTLLPSDIEVAQGVKVTTPLRTGLDLGRLTPRDHAIAALDGLLHLGRFEQVELLQQVGRFRGQRGVVQLRELAPLADGRAESPGESVMRLRWIDANLPPAVPQVPVVGTWGIVRAYVDLGVEELRFGAEYDGWDWHSSPEQREHDRERRKWLREEKGWRIVVLTKREVFGPGLDLAGRMLKAELAAHLTAADGLTRRFSTDTPRKQVGK